MSRRGSSDVFSYLPSALRQFHAMHRASLEQMRKGCEQAETLEAVQELGAEMKYFANGLDMHHRIEDATMFPPIARKQDISHLEAHHHELEGMLTAFSKYAQKLRRLEAFSSWERGATSKAIVELEKLVNEHEAAEEAVCSVENLKKLFTAEEAAAAFRH